MAAIKSTAFQLCALFVTLLTITIGSVAADATFTPILPPSYPLAFRSPYLSAWLPGNEVANLPSAIAQFWQSQQLTWSVIARVDGNTYSLFGVPRPRDLIQPASLTSADFTATHTTFTVTASDVKFVLDFFSPVSPQNYARQGMPFSYLTISTSSLGSGTPSVQIYSDMDNSWVGQFGDGDHIQLNWNWGTTQEATQVFTLSQKGTAKLSEEADMTLWGTAAYCTRENASRLSSTVGNVDEVRNSFAANADLAGGGEFRPGSVFAYSHDLGSLEGTGNVTFVIGHVRDPAVSYHGVGRSSYWQSVCKDINCGCVHALDDFHAANEESRNLDAYLAGPKISSANYSDILVLSTRQTFGTLELTIPSDNLGAKSVLAFVKEISRFVLELYNRALVTDAERTHFTMFEGDGESWGLQFNLYLDVLLKLNTFPTEAYAMQATFYRSVRRAAGVPLDSRDSWAKTDWMMFAAATAMAPGVEDEGVRDMFVDDIHAYAANRKNNVPFSDKFWTETKVGRDGKTHEIGSHDGYRARPVAGGHFALLALDGPNQWPGSDKE